jgi:hypothetical protein
MTACRARAGRQRSSRPARGDRFSPTTDCTAYITCAVYTACTVYTSPYSVLAYASQPVLCTQYKDTRQPVKHCHHHRRASSISRSYILSLIQSLLSRQYILPDSVPSPNSPSPRSHVPRLSTSKLKAPGRTYPRSTRDVTILQLRPSRLAILQLRPSRPSRLGAHVPKVLLLQRHRNAAEARHLGSLHRPAYSSIRVVRATLPIQLCAGGGQVPIRQLAVRVGSGSGGGGGVGYHPEVGQVLPRACTCVTKQRIRRAAAPGTV